MPRDAKVAIESAAEEAVRDERAEETEADKRTTTPCRAPRHAVVGDVRESPARLATALLVVQFMHRRRRSTKLGWITGPYSVLAGCLRWP